MVKKPSPVVVLIGFMGAGKTSVGKRLARRVGWDYFDTDEMIEKKLGLSIADIFAQLGEERFRKEETVILREIQPNEPAVVVTGGGTILREQNVKRLRELGTIVWLAAAPEELCRRVAPRKDRPLLPAENPCGEIVRLLRERAGAYEAAADLVIDTTALKPQEVVRQICHELAITG